MAADFPEAFVQRMGNDLGEDAKPLLEALDSPPPVSIRLNPDREAKPISGSPIPWCSQGLYLPERPSFTLDPQIHAGGYYVQEAASMFLDTVLKHLNPNQDPWTALDLCGAPGGKSTLLASSVGREGMVVANEVIRSRVRILEENLVKWGLPHTAVANRDAAYWSRWDEAFDLMLVDAPCSGEGLFRKDLAARTNWSLEQVEHCAVRQRRILADALPALRPGGYLIYSTCTFAEAENEENVTWLMEGHGLELEKIPISPDWEVTVSTIKSGETYRFYPHKSMGEGFFLACLKKPGNDSWFEPFKRLKPRYWQRLPKRDLEAVSIFLNDPEQFTYWVDERDNVRACPKTWHEEHLGFLEAAGVRSFGVLLGKRSRKEFIPAHDLALSTAISTELPALEVDLSMALKFLRKEVWRPEHSLEPGWRLVRYEGLNLGWVKVLKDRLNNYYPKEWRIRMEA